MRKLLTAILAILLFVSISPAKIVKAGNTANAADLFDGTGTEADPYILKDVNDILSLNTLVLEDAQNDQLCYKLANTFNDTTPITETITVYFKSFDGNNKTIYLDMDADVCCSLFYEVYNATIKNLVIEGSVHDSEGEEICAAPLVTDISNSTIENVINNCDVILTTDQANAGGFAYCAVNTTFKNCVNNATISGNYAFPFAIGSVGITYIDCVNNGTINYEALNDYVHSNDKKMAYFIQNNEFDVSFNLKNYFRIVSFDNGGFHINWSSVEEIELENQISCTFLEGKSTIVVNVTYTNNSGESVTFTPYIESDTCIDGDDGSANAFENGILTMTANGVGLFVTSTDEGYNAIPTDYDYEGSGLSEFPYLPEASDSYVVLHWNEITLANEQSATYTIYFGMANEDEIHDLANQMGKPQLISANDNEFDVDKKGKGQATFKIANTKEMSAHIYGLELSDVVENSIANPSNPWEHIVVTYNGKKLTYGTDYTVSAGSIKVTLTKSFLDSLKLGKHVINIAVDASDSNTYDFDINVTIKNSLTPTGVDSSLFKVSCLATLSLAAMLIVLRKKKEN